jgi:hypothetical protein
MPPSQVESMGVSHAAGARNTDLFLTDMQADQYEQAVIWRHKLKYRFDSFMAKGGASIFKALLLSFLMIFFLKLWETPFPNMSSR